MPQDNGTRIVAGNFASTARKTALRCDVLDLLTDIRNAKPQERPALRAAMTAIVAELKTYYPEV